jgi:hypothetical protein
LLPFTWQTYKLGSTFYSPLPKLSPAQEGILTRRLKSTGFKVRKDACILGRKGRVVISISSTGVCSSNEDPTEVIAPCVPELLGVEKHPVPLEELRARYFATKESGRRTWVKFETRLEHGSAWRALRRQRSNALTPDEYEVLSSLLKGALGKVEMPAEFPTGPHDPRVRGAGSCFMSRLSPGEAIRTLDPLGKAKRSFVPSGGTFVLRLASPPGALSEPVLRDLGDWCGLAPLEQ